MRSKDKEQPEYLPVTNAMPSILGGRQIRLTWQV